MKTLVGSFLASLVLFLLVVALFFPEYFGVDHPAATGSGAIQDGNEVVSQPEQWHGWLLVDWDQPEGEPPRLLVYHPWSSCKNDSYLTYSHSDMYADGRYFFYKVPEDGYYDHERIALNPSTGRVVAYSEEYHTRGQITQTQNGWIVHSDSVEASCLGSFPTEDEEIYYLRPHNIPSGVCDKHRRAKGNSSLCPPWYKGQPLRCSTDC